MEHLLSKWNAWFELTVAENTLCNSYFQSINLIGQEASNSADRLTRCVIMLHRSLKKSWKTGNISHSWDTLYWSSCRLKNSRPNEKGLCLLLDLVMAQRLRTISELIKSLTLLTLHHLLYKSQRWQVYSITVNQHRWPPQSLPRRTCEDLWRVSVLCSAGYISDQ